MTARILIVENEAITALDLEETLSDAGYFIAGVAASAREALELAQSNPPDLALLDIGIAGPVDGVDLANALQESFVLAHVFLTGHNEPETRARADRTNPLGYIVKPFEDSQLLAGVNIALCRHERRCKALAALHSPFLMDRHFQVLQPAVSVGAACPMEPQCSSRFAPPLAAAAR